MNLEKDVLGLVRMVNINKERTNFAHFKQNGFTIQDFLKFCDASTIKLGIDQIMISAGLNPNMPF